MAELLEAINAFLLAGVGQPWVLLALFGLCMVDGLFPPIPSESVVVTLAAYASATGEPRLWALVALAALGAITGDNLAYVVGRRVHAHGLGWIQRPRTRRILAATTRELDRRGALLILTARYIPVGRVVVNTAAGATGFHRPRFVGLTVVAGIAWAAWSVTIGAIAGQWVKDNPLLGAAVGIAVALVAGTAIDLLLRRWQRRSPVRADDDPHPPESAAPAECDRVA